MVQLEPESVRFTLPTCLAQLPAEERELCARLHRVARRDKLRANVKARILKSMRKERAR